MSGWKQIETAPKDGSWILLTGGRIDYGWDYEPKPPVVVACWSNGHASWQFAYFDGGYYGEYENPTKWMPIPDGCE